MLKKNFLALAAFLKKLLPAFFITADLLVVPAFFLCRWMTSQMLNTNKPCRYALMGLDCITCGGTRCVRAFTEGNLSEAFRMNAFIFLCILLFMCILVLGNLVYVFRLEKPKKLLNKIINPYFLAGFIVFMVVFFLLRNIDNVFIIIKNLYENLQSAELP